MASQQSLVQVVCQLFFIFSISILPCHYYCLQEDPPLVSNNYYTIEEESGYDSQAYPSNYITTLDDGKFKDLINLKTDEVLSFRWFDKLGTTTASSSDKIFNVNDFIRGHGVGDHTEAFEKAWKAACSTNGGVLVVPEDDYLLKPTKFSGPCKSNITVQIHGSLVASDDRLDYKQDGQHWLLFDGIQNLLVEGGGVIDGKGQIWWENSCKVDKALPCEDAPTALTFQRCENLVVRNLSVQNAQQMHVTFRKSKNVVVSNLMVTSPEHSPNTDGIHVSKSQNIQITNSVIGTGDDCISIVSGSQNVQATDIICGPGHGISIGSLGSKGSKAYVSGVTIDGAKISGTTNGVRIKTWQGGSGSASNIKFQNIEMHNVINPIIIDQNYCDHHKPCKEQKSAVHVTNVVYKNIKGTSASDVAIKFDCSKTFPCEGILLQDVTLETEAGRDAQAFCNNVKLAELGHVSPRCP